MHTIMLNFTGHYTTNIKRKKKPAAQDKVSNRVGGTKLDADLPKPNSLLGARALIEARSVVRVRHAPRGRIASVVGSMICAAGSETTRVLIARVNSRQAGR
jgi:hypothetical protein